MMHKRRNLSLAATLMGATLLLTTGCGGQSLAEASSAPAVNAPVQLDQAPAEDKAAGTINAIQPNADLSAKVPQSVKDKGLKMTTSEGYPPMEMFATDGKTLVGVDPSLGRAIARKLGVKLSIANEDFNSQIPGVTTGRYDFIMSSMTDNATRRETVTFVDYVSAGNGFVVKKGNPAGIKSAKDVCGKTLAVVDNGSSLKLAEAMSTACTTAGSAAVNILKFPGDQEAILQVRNGRADAGINDYPVAAYRAQSSEGALDAVAITGDESLWGIAMKPENKDLVGAVQGALDDLIKDGSYAKILDAWAVGQMAVKSASVNGGS